MGLFGDLVTGALGGFSSKPSVPSWKSVTLGGTSGAQSEAIASNLSNLPGAEDLAGQVTQFNQDQITKMLEAVIPGWSGISGTASSTIKSMLEGKIPSDVAAAIQQSSAAQSLTGGFGGSGLAGNLTFKIGTF